MDIRDVRPEEHEALGALTIAAYRTMGDVLTPEYEAELADVAGRSAVATVLVASEGGSLLGGVTYIPDADNPLAEHVDPHAASIRMLAVDPAAHRQGVGRRLTEACTARAASEGKESVILHTVDSNATGLAFYEALGFERAPELDWEPVPGLRLVGLRIEVAFGG
jgi:ribosomal protein S18 acetylase RimI-like enzyme